VLGTKGELWLARNQEDDSGKLGWIWEKHFARIVLETHSTSNELAARSSTGHKPPNLGSNANNAKENMDKFERDLRLALQREALRFPPATSRRKFYTIPFLRRRPRSLSLDEMANKFSDLESR
jgi:hypothetical protein